MLRVTQPHPPSQPALSGIAATMTFYTVTITDLYIFYPDAVPPIHAVSSHVATDKDPSK